ncbi:transporter substrate-binding domain-containing protein [Limibaculum sp. M0105]|uniref:Transporter substrate-binding domain-containing protein n=1 Tax=Thermohalobaculum xanthum TaxID=2753746 RepID=A0A8J7SA13_9RHOB|nr:transporter substrate-binding domain-containing protein [Thermohalobaculum xanthum]MBK0398042.1 transporter substrate-binding domain-containing protein [Thermohalobaculum xanthum]
MPEDSPFPLVTRRRALGLLSAATALPGIALAQSGVLKDGEDIATALADDELVAAVAEPWTGDLNGIVERGFLRLGTGMDPVLFRYEHADRGRTIEQRGLIVEAAAELEAALRKKLGKPARDLTMLIAPVARDRLIPGLLEGRVDAVAAMLTITPERAAVVAFTDPTIEEVDEIVVTGPKAPEITSVDDLVGTGVFLRKSSSYHEHVIALNAEREAKGLAPIPVTAVDENLEDPDILELVSAGTFPLAIFDSHMAPLYAKVFGDLTVRDDIAVARGGKIAMAVRPDAPELLAALNEIVPRFRKGTLLGNTLRKRHLEDSERLKNAMEPEAQERFRETIGIIAKYADQYDFDRILIAAQGFQESRLDQSKRSRAGAVGIMQVMPQTARDPNVGVRDIHLAEPNVEAGVKYLRFVRDRYFSDPAMTPLDQALFSFAAYNAGPGNISKARRKAEKMGLDPNRWFGHVEIATARSVSREPVIYVRNILKYYASYKVFAAGQLRQDG